ncbi:hypothetical protein Tco_1064158, partial [Tanacetum coccineum]
MAEDVKLNIDRVKRVSRHSREDYRACVEFRNHSKLGGRSDTSEGYERVGASRIMEAQ